MNITVPAQEFFRKGEYIRLIRKLAPGDLLPVGVGFRKKSTVMIIALMLITLHYSFPAHAAKLQPVMPGNNNEVSYKNGNIPTEKLLKSYLEFSSMRHRVLSENIANLNTPGYKAKETAIPKKYSDLSGSRPGGKLRLRATSELHMHGNIKAGQNFAVYKISDAFELKPNGNNVSLTQQMTKLSQNKQNYHSTVKSYAAMGSLVSAVLGK